MERMLLNKYQIIMCVSKVSKVDWLASFTPWFVSMYQEVEQVSILPSFTINIPQEIVLTSDKAHSTQHLC